MRETQPARIKLAAFIFRKYGMLDGQVAHVSADSAEQNSNTATGGQGQAKGGATPLACRTLVSLKSQFLEADGQKYSLAPGMQVSAEISFLRSPGPSGGGARAMKSM